MTGAVPDFQGDLLDWYARHQRTLPWRQTDDAYAVLVSEIMLQQTQVSRVLPAYQSFMQQFPTVSGLAAAPVADVVRCWAGLGYNRRAVALHSAARRIVALHQGVVPDNLAELQALPGVGAYTARAILAFAFGRDEAPVDTNVGRVLMRVTATASRGRALQELADGAVPRGRGRSWSAALMDFGSAVCTAAKPKCPVCPVRQRCAWLAAGGPDPAAASRAGSAPFAGSNRFHRGRLLAALRDHAVPRGELAAAAATDCSERAQQVAAGLVADGLASWEGDSLGLPA